MSSGRSCARGAARARAQLRYARARARLRAVGGSPGETGRGRPGVVATSHIGKPLGETAHMLLGQN
eukprot:285357-Prymnesium_polylepis.1